MDQIITLIFEKMKHTMIAGLLKILNSTKDSAISTEYLICSKDLEEEAKNITLKMVNQCIVYVVE